MTNTRRRVIFLKRLSALTHAAESLGMGFIIYTFYRSADDQNVRYQQGRTLPGKIITNCDGHRKKSKHQNWLAVDIVLVYKGKCDWGADMLYQVLGEIWERLGGTWGGRWKSPHDPYHFEYKE